METTDIWFASWLQARSYELKDFATIARGKGRYVFVITPEKWKEEKLSFSNSEVSRVKTCYSALKDLLF